MWSQTPQFNLLLEPQNDIGIDMNVHHGIIKSLDFNSSSRIPETLREELRRVLVDQRLQDIRKWNPFLKDRLRTWNNRSNEFADRLEGLLPIPQLSIS
jgi:lipoate-protein ligase A